MVHIEEILGKKEFSALSQRQKELILEASGKCAGMDQSAVIMVFMRYIPMIEAERKLTPQEKQGLIGCIMESLDENGKKTAKTILDTAERFMK
ncbi:hypothetical protein MUJ63_01895 [Lachnospiraceae bacterium NSJ-143]|nr:hypothetical protein [Lachnospiraceae bacterium NSJ-143]